jgi:hypothetical protein
LAAPLEVNRKKEKKVVVKKTQVTAAVQLKPAKKQPEAPVKKPKVVSK